MLKPQQSVVINYVVSEIPCESAVPLSSTTQSQFETLKRVDKTAETEMRL